ncbi:hypothetical protein [Phycicoccus sonneratiae]|uniref:Uncharacterized protein n=1 Tax=Phycicoccus sonneratiae TaxID=2807628 RepID=A0ABS2CNN1_9MICO|nr:hypothetical protein [Phycicoccus sonneraticus]MBM6401491.1 hypothetical protein [Phycicoccus sonneraticus]
MTVEQPVPGFAAPPQLPPPVGAYPVGAVVAEAGPITPVQEQTSDGLRVRWDGTVLAPSSVMNAVYLMWAGAVLALLEGIVTAFRAETAVDEVLASTGLAVDPGVAGAVVTGVKVASVGWGLVLALVWMWVASGNAKGRGGARVAATVFYAFAVLGVLITALGALSGGLADLLLALPGFAVGTGAIVLLWLPSSSRYYALVRSRRR